MNGLKTVAGLVFAAACMSTALAGSLRVTPVTIQMAPGQAASTVNLTNTGDKPLRVQVRVFAWSQSNGEDKLEATQALLASPPAIDVAPQSIQTIRLVRPAKTPITQEESYRIIVDELAEPSTDPSTGVNVQLRYSIPVFLSPAGMKPPRITVTANVEGQALLLKVDNRGGQHAQLAAVTLEDASGQKVKVEEGLLGYALVGQSMQWKVALPPGAAGKGRLVLLRCLVNGDEFSLKL